MFVKILPFPPLSGGGSSLALGSVELSFVLLANRQGQKKRVENKGKGKSVTRKNLLLKQGKKLPISGSGSFISRSLLRERRDAKGSSKGY